MKSLLRKKTHADIQKPSPPSSAQNIRYTATIDTPLYARFASVKPGGQSPEKNRPTVSGPMPLGRPSRSNHEPGDNRRKREDSPLPRPRLSNGRQGIALGSQSLPNSLPGQSDAQPSLDLLYQDVRVNPTQATRQPIKAQTACKSCLSSSYHAQIFCAASIYRVFTTRDASGTSEHLNTATVPFPSITARPFFCLPLVPSRQCRMSMLTCS